MIYWFFLGFLVFLFILVVVYFFWKPVAFFQRIHRGIIAISGYDYKWFDSQHEKIGYFVGGEGQNMILVHGFMVHAGNWSTIAPKLKKDFRVTIPDLPGHGKSPWTASRNLEELGESILEFLLAKTEDEPAILIGNSMGGAIVFQFALEYPERVKKLIVINSAGLEWEVDRNLLLPKDRKNALRKIRAIVNPKLNLPTFFLDALVKETTIDFENLLEDALSSSDYFLNQKLKDLKIKSHVLWGEKDGLFPMDYAQELLKLLPSYDFKIFPKAAHVPHNTNPKETLAYLHDVINAK
jgi:pimeloyl-ACP methyl ester carboxylesterase